MKAILLMFDSLNRRMLSPYGCRDVVTPNFNRLAGECTRFDNCWAGSLPCIPARRDLHTGRLNFLHRSWGPLEPWDVSFVENLRKNNVFTHLVSDHIHYWEEGGGNYHTKYNTWECVRGQEGDPWKPSADPDDSTAIMGREAKARVQDKVNARFVAGEEDFPIHRVFQGGLDFIRENSKYDNWFLQIESFDPHEPFHMAGKFREEYAFDYSQSDFDWPSYTKCTETEADRAHGIMSYRALVTACDHYLGELLDAMDRYRLWEDTLLIVTTDHGYLLGEHGWWAKTVQPVYNEVAQLPLFVHYPGFGKEKSNDSLTQLIDIAPTMTEFFGLPALKGIHGISLRRALEKGNNGRRAALFGLHGCHVNVTDGRYVYMKAPDEAMPLYDYTLMPSEMKHPFPLDRMQQAALAAPFRFTRGLPVLRVPAQKWGDVDFREYPDLLFDLKHDPKQMDSISSSKVTKRMQKKLLTLLSENEAPVELYRRLELQQPGQRESF